MSRVIDAGFVVDSGRFNGRASRTEFGRDDEKTTEPAVTADPLPFTKDDFTPSKLLALLFPEDFTRASSLVRQKLATREWVSAACHYMLST